MSNNLEYEVNIRTKTVLDKFAKKNGLIKAKSNDRNHIMDIILKSSLNNEKIIDEIKEFPISEKLKSQYIKSRHSVTPEKRSHLKKNPFNELLLYICFNDKKKISYGYVTRFLSSFGISSEEIHFTLTRKIIDEDVVLVSNDDEYKKIIKYLINENITKYPLAIKVENAYHNFAFLGYNHPDEFDSIFQKLNKKYPDFLSFSPIKSGSRTDLITIRQFFSNDSIFTKNNRWSD